MFRFLEQTLAREQRNPQKAVRADCAHGTLVRSPRYTLAAFSFGFPPVAIDEEKPDFALDIAKDAGRTLQTTFAAAAAAGAVAFAEATHNIPFGVGAALLTLVGELAGRRINGRLNDVVEHFTNRLRELGEAKIDREWFTSEEFQTLLFDALRQLQVICVGAIL